MGELHLEIIVDRLLREFRSQANVGKPQVAYKETITQPAHAEGRYVKPDGRHGPVRRTSCSRSSRTSAARASSSRTRSSGRRDAARVHQAVEQGVREALQSGVLARLSRSSTSQVRLVDGSYHEVDSSELAFKIAGSMGVKDALDKAQAGAARADHERRGRRARGLHGRGASAT